MEIALPIVKMSVFIIKRNGSYLFLALQMPNISHFLFFDVNSVYCFTMQYVRVHVTVYTC